MLDEGGLKRMSSFEPLDRRHASAIDVRRRDEARIHRHAVDEYRARATLPFAASFFCAGERTILSQHIQQTLEWMHIQRRSLAVEDEAH